MTEERPLYFEELTTRVQWAIVDAMLGLETKELTEAEKEEVRQWARPTSEEIQEQLAKDACER